jgi:hypothetical protein
MVGRISSEVVYERSVYEKLIRNVWWCYYEREWLHSTFVTGWLSEWPDQPFSRLRVHPRCSNEEHYLYPCCWEPKPDRLASSQLLYSPLIFLDLWWCGCRWGGGGCVPVPNDALTRHQPTGVCSWPESYQVICMASFGLFTSDCIKNTETM